MGGRPFLGKIPEQGLGIAFAVVMVVAAARLALT